MRKFRSFMAAAAIVACTTPVYAADVVQTYFDNSSYYAQVSPQFRCSKYNDTSHLGWKIFTDQGFQGRDSVRMYVRVGIWIDIGTLIPTSFTTYRFVKDESEFTDEEIRKIIDVGFKALNDKCVREWEDHKFRMLNFKKRLSESE